MRPDWHVNLAFDERKKLLWHRQVLSSLADLAKVCGIRQHS